MAGVVRRRQIFAAAAAAAVGSFGPASAQDATGPMVIPLEEEEGEEGKAANAGSAMEMAPVVISATRNETPASELTRSVTVVPREEIERQARVNRNLGNILGHKVPGMSPTTNALSNFGQTLRGRDFLTLIDGVPQSTPLRSASRDLNTIDPNAIERIEVVRGGTAAYGFGAAGGLINIVTRQPGPGEVEAHSEFGLKMSTEHPDDSFTLSNSHSLSARLDDTDFLLSGTFVGRQSSFDSDGDRIPPDPLGVQGGLDDTNELNILGKVGHDFDDGRQRLELTANHFRIRQDTNYTFGTGDPATGTKTPAVRGRFNVEEPGTVNTTVNLAWEHDDILGSSLKAQAYYNDLTATFAKFPGFAQTEIVSEKAGTRATVETPVPVWGVPLEVVWGFDFLHDETVQEGIDGPTIVPEMTQDAIAGFAELEIPIGEWGLLRAGIRQEHIDLEIEDVVNGNGIFVEGGRLEFDETLFNASAVAFVTDEIDVFASFAQGFSVADIGRAIRDGTATSATDLEAEAQKVDSYEIGVRGNFGRASASIAGFYSESENGTTFDTNLEIAKQPERIWGIEASGDFRIDEQWRVGGTATWIEGEVDLDDGGGFEEDLPSTRVPPVKLTAFVEYDPFPWWRNRVQAVYSGSRDPDSTQFGGSEVDDYVVFDLYSGFDVGPGELAITVENLFNEDYFPMGVQAAAASYAHTEGPGRTIGATYSFRW